LKLLVTSKGKKAAPKFKSGHPIERTSKRTITLHPALS
jgi:hypothetical protein